MNKAFKSIILTSLFLILFGLLLLWVGVTSSQQESYIPRSTPLVENIDEATTSAVAGTEGERVLVTKVIDGDTIKVGKQTVRLIGIDTPETVHPKKAVECFGKQASQKTKELLESQFVILEKDVSETDKYGRLLRYVYLPLDEDKMLFINDFLVREGFAQVLTYPPDVKYDERLRRAEKEAKENLRGLWSNC